MLLLPLLRAHGVSGNLIFCHMYFYRICVLYRLRRRAQHKMRGRWKPKNGRDKREWERKRDECEKRVFYFIFFSPGKRGTVVWQHKTNIHTYIQTYRHAYAHVCMYVCLYEKLRLSSGSKKISLEILKALGREKKNRIWYSKAKLTHNSNQMKWNCPTAAVCVCVCTLIYMCVCVRLTE